MEITKLVAICHERVIFSLLFFVAPVNILFALFALTLLLTIILFLFLLLLGFPFLASKSVETGLELEEDLNPLPHMPILGSSNSATNKAMMSKILTNGGTMF